MPKRNHVDVGLREILSESRELSKTVFIVLVMGTIINVLASAVYNVLGWSVEMWIFILFLVGLLTSIFASGRLLERREGKEMVKIPFVCMPTLEFIPSESLTVRSAISILSERFKELEKKNPNLIEQLKKDDTYKTHYLINSLEKVIKYILLSWLRFTYRDEEGDRSEEIRKTIEHACHNGLL